MKAEKLYKFRCLRANHGKIVKESDLEKTKRGFKIPKCDFCSGRLKLIKTIG